MIIKGKSNTKSSSYLPKIIVSLLGLTLVYLIGSNITWNTKEPLQKEDYFCDAESVEKGNFIGINHQFNNGYTQSDEKSRSGKYSSKLDGSQQYGMSLTLNNLEKGMRYEVSIWRWTQYEKKAGVAIKSSPNKSFYAQTNLGSEKDKNGWEKLTVDVMIPEDADVNQLTIYTFFYGKDGLAYFDDLKISKLPLSYKEATDLNKIHLYLDPKALSKINTKRSEAIRKGILQSADDDWVKAKFTHMDSLEYDVKMRLKGDWTDHLTGDYWSYRIKMPSDKSWNRIQTFSLQAPESRYFLSEWLYHQALEQADIITPRYGFVEFQQNDQDPVIYSYEEHFDKQIAEYKYRREGVILKYSEDYLWDQRLKNQKAKKGDAFENARSKSEVLAFKEGKTMSSAKLKEQFLRGQDLLYAYKHQLKPASEIFDIERMAKYFAITDVFNANHGIIWHNQRFYYNPITRKLEPIGFDGFTETGHFRLHTNLFFGEFKSSESDTEWTSYYQHLYRDPEFNKYYVPAMLEYSNPEYINGLLETYKDDLAHYQHLLNSFQYPDYKFDKDELRERAKFIHENIQPYDNTSLKAYRKINKEGKSVVVVSNEHCLPLTVVGSAPKRTMVAGMKASKIINSNDRLGKPAFTEIDVKVGDKFVFYKLEGDNKLYTTNIRAWRPAEEPKISYGDQQDLEMPLPEGAFMLEDNSILIKTGEYTLTSPMIIPRGKKVTIENGVQINLTNKSYILSYSDIHFAGSKVAPIRITSSDKSSQGVVVMNGDKSIVTYTEFTNLNTLEENEWQLTGAVTFYETDVEMTYVTISQNLCEDALNIVRGNFSIQALNINNTYADGFDCDFCKGKIFDSRLYNTGNDALDYSGSFITISDVEMQTIGDKGISAGEEATLIVNRVKIDGADIGVASKDLSKVNVENLSLKNCSQGFAAYRKKPEFGGGNIKVSSYTAEGVNRLLMTDSESKITLPK